jgi:excisionase family DNA binding protein
MQAELFSPTETAKFLGISTKTLREITSNGHGPPYLFIGKAIKYPRTQLLEWIEQKTIGVRNEQGTETN